MDKSVLENIRSDAFRRTIAQDLLDRFALVFYGAIFGIDGDDIEGVLQEQPESVFIRFQFSLYLFPFRDIPLYGPDSFQVTLLGNTDQVDDVIVFPVLFVQGPDLFIGKQVTSLYELSQVFPVRPGGRQQIFQGGTENVDGMGIPVHAGHGVVTFRQLCIFIEMFYLFSRDSLNGQGVFDLETADPFRTLSDKGLIAGIALPEQFLRSPAFGDIFYG